MNDKIEKRIQGGIKRYQTVLRNAKTKDVNESDTVVIITDMLNDIFGYDKYCEITSEFAIKKTYCDLAIILNDKVKLLVECKAIGMDLKEEHVKQACDYASNLGIDWTILSNGQYWRVYKMIFSKPVTRELVYEFNFLELSSKRKSDLEELYYLTKEAVTKSKLEEYYYQRQIISKHFIGQLLSTELIADVVRRQLRKISPKIKIDNKQIIELIENDILKREIIEGETAEITRKRVNKALRDINRKSNKKQKVEISN